MSALGQFWRRVTPAQLKRIVLAVLALALVPVAVVLLGQGGGSAGGTGGGWQSPASIFAARSPGRRNDNAVFWVKKRLGAAPRVLVPQPRRERVLPARRARPSPTTITPGYGPLALLGEPSPIGFPPPATMGLAPAVPAFSAPGFDGLFALPPSPGIPGSDGADPLPTPGPAVPELATWLQMVLAIGALGVMLRRAERTARTLAPKEIVTGSPVRVVGPRPRYHAHDRNLGGVHSRPPEP